MTAIASLDLSDLRLVKNAKGEVVGGYSLYRSAPSFDAFSSQMYCPECSCNKSEDLDTPNTITEACSDGACLCHVENPCGDCGEDLDTDDETIRFHSGCCAHDAVDSDDDGLVSRWFVCTDCGERVEADYDYEDGRVYWTVAA